MIITRKVTLTGYFIGDAGQLLYSNFNKEFTSRQAAAQQLAKQGESLGANRKLLQISAIVLIPCELLFMVLCYTGISYDKVFDFGCFFLL